MARRRRTLVSGAPKWLTLVALFELAGACSEVLGGDGFNVAVDLFGCVCCLLAAFLTVHNRIITEEHEERMKRWEEHIREHG